MTPLAAPLPLGLVSSIAVNSVLTDAAGNLIVEWQAFDAAGTRVSLRRDVILASHPIVASLGAATVATLGTKLEGALAAFFMQAGHAALPEVVAKDASVAAGSPAVSPATAIAAKGRGRFGVSSLAGKS